MRLSLLFAISALSLFSAAPALACSCPPPPERAAMPPPSATERSAEPAGAVFEGTVVSAQLRGELIDAKAGDIVPANLDETPLFMLVSFNVSRSYPSDARKTAEVKTGLGGGDCGYAFEVGKQYLVHAGKDDTGRLVTGVCSQTSLLDASGSSDKKTLSETGEICGHVVQQPNQERSAEGRVFLFSGGNKSPVPTDNAEVREDNSFCAANIDPGEYFLLFVSGAEGAPASFAFFPDVTNLADATKIEVGPGQQIQNVLIKVPFQPLYSVKGAIVPFDKANLELKPKVLLIDPEQVSFATLYAGDVSPDGSFEFPGVLPGKYWAIVNIESVSDSQWLTRKASVEVDGNVSGVSLTLVPK